MGRDAKKRHGAAPKTVAPAGGSHASDGGAEGTPPLDARIKEVSKELKKGNIHKGKKLLMPLVEDRRDDPRVARLYYHLLKEFEVEPSLRGVQDPDERKRKEAEVLKAALPGLVSHTHGDGPVSLRVIFDAAIVLSKWGHAEGSDREEVYSELRHLATLFGPDAKQKWMDPAAEDVIYSDDTNGLPETPLDELVATLRENVKNVVVELMLRFRHFKNDGGSEMGPEFAKLMKEAGSSMVVLNSEVELDIRKMKKDLAQAPSRRELEFEEAKKAIQRQQAPRGGNGHGSGGMDPKDPGRRQAGGEARPGGDARKQTARDKVVKTVQDSVDQHAKIVKAYWKARMEDAGAANPAAGGEGAEKGKIAQQRRQLEELAAKSFREIAGAFKPSKSPGKAKPPGKAKGKDKGQPKILSRALSQALSQGGAASEKNPHWRKVLEERSTPEQLQKQLAWAEVHGTLRYFECPVTGAWFPTPVEAWSSAQGGMEELAGVIQSAMHSPTTPDPGAPLPDIEGGGAGGGASSREVLADYISDRHFDANGLKNDFESCMYGPYANMNIINSRIGFPHFGADRDETKRRPRGLPPATLPESAHKRILARLDMLFLPTADAALLCEAIEYIGDNLNENEGLLWWLMEVPGAESGRLPTAEEQKSLLGSKLMDAHLIQALHSLFHNAQIIGQNIERALGEARERARMTVDVVETALKEAGCDAEEMLRKRETGEIPDPDYHRIATLAILHHMQNKGWLSRAVVELLCFYIETVIKTKRGKVPARRIDLDDIALLDPSDVKDMYNALVKCAVQCTAWYEIEDRDFDALERVEWSGRGESVKPVMMSEVLGGLIAAKTGKEVEEGHPSLAESLQRYRPKGAKWCGESSSDDPPLLRSLEAAHVIGENLDLQYWWEDKLQADEAGDREGNEPWRASVDRLEEFLKRPCSGDFKKVDSWSPGEDAELYAQMEARLGDYCKATLTKDVWDEDPSMEEELGGLVARNKSARHLRALMLLRASRSLDALERQTGAHVLQLTESLAEVRQIIKLFDEHCVLEKDSQGKVIRTVKSPLMANQLKGYKKTEAEFVQWISLFPDVQQRLGKAAQAVEMRAKEVQAEAETFALRDQLKADDILGDQQKFEVLKAELDHDAGALEPKAIAHVARRMLSVFEATQVSQYFKRTMEAKNMILNRSLQYCECLGRQVLQTLSRDVRQAAEDWVADNAQKLMEENPNWMQSGEAHKGARGGGGAGGGEGKKSKTSRKKKGGAAKPAPPSGSSPSKTGAAAGEGGGEAEAEADAVALAEADRKAQVKRQREAEMEAALEARRLELTAAAEREEEDAVRLVEESQRAEEERQKQRLRDAEQAHRERQRVEEKTRRREAEQEEERIRQARQAQEEEEEWLGSGRGVHTLGSPHPERPPAAEAASSGDAPPAEPATPPAPGGPRSKKEKRIKRKGGGQKGGGQGVRPEAAAPFTGTGTPHKKWGATCQVNADGSVQSNASMDELLSGAQPTDRPQPPPPALMPVAPENAGMSMAIAVAPAYPPMLVPSAPMPTHMYSATQPAYAGHCFSATATFAPPVYSAVRGEAPPPYGIPPPASAAPAPYVPGAGAPPPPYVASGGQGGHPVATAPPPAYMSMSGLPPPAYMTYSQPHEMQYTHMPPGYAVQLPLPSPAPVPVPLPVPGPGPAPPPPGPAPMSSPPPPAPTISTPSMSISTPPLPSGLAGGVDVGALCQNLGVSGGPGGTPGYADMATSPVVVREATPPRPEEGEGPGGETGADERDAGEDGPARELTAEEQFEEDLKKAIEASMTQEKGPRPPRAAAGGGSLAAGSAFKDEEFPTLGGRPSSGAGGLRNETGEYNCFLNVVIQSLWHLNSFRGALAGVGEHVHVGDPCVLCALQKLFVELGGQGGTAAAPTELRRALEGLGESKSLFRLAEMNDASEAVQEICHSLHRALAPGHSDWCPGGGDGECTICRHFGIPINEVMRCGACGTDTHKLDYTKGNSLVPAAALAGVKAGLVETGRPSGFGHILREMYAMDRKPCDKDEGGCGASLPTDHSLVRAPAVFTSVLVWESANPSESDIVAAVEALETEVDLACVYHTVPPGVQHIYTLQCVVCYYGEHYFAFVNKAGEGGGGEEWCMCDDMTVKIVGTWAQVAEQCRRGRLQPSVLFYEREGAPGRSVARPGPGAWGGGQNKIIASAREAALAAEDYPGL